VLALPQRLWFESEEILSSFLISKLDEHRAFEQLLGTTTKTNCISWAKLSKESFNVKLRAGFLVTEAFDIDRPGFRGRLCGGRIVSNLAFDLLVTFWTGNFKEVAFS
jgi:hypothetical protein